jgi:hypothetical protein
MRSSASIRACPRSLRPAGCRASMRAVGRLILANRQIAFSATALSICAATVSAMIAVAPSAEAVTLSRSGSAAASATQAPPSTSASISVLLRVNPIAGTERVVSTGPGTSVGAMRPTLRHINSSSSSGYNCVAYIRSFKSRMHTYKPAYIYQEGNSYAADWFIEPYGLTKARIVNGGWTFQVQLCLTGGGDVWNGYRQTFDGGSLALGTKTPRKLGVGKWGTHVTKGQILTTLQFQVSAGPASVTATVGLTRSNTYTGSPGYQPTIGVLYHRSWDVNRVNGWYASPDNFIWDGTDTFQGNTVQGLFEYYNGGAQTSFDYAAGARLAAHCAKLDHDCAPLV